MAAADHIREAIRLLSKNGFSDVPTHQVSESVAHARIALAQAVEDLAHAASADKPIPAGPAPDGVTARIVTAYGRRYNDHRATTDIHDNGQGECRPCGWSSLPTVDRNEAVTDATRHADTCMALPQPTDEEAVR